MKTELVLEISFEYRHEVLQMFLKHDNYYENKHVIRHCRHIAVVLKEKDMQVLKHLSDVIYTFLS